MCANSKMVASSAMESNSNLSSLSQRPVSYTCVPKDQNDRCEIYGLNENLQIACAQCVTGYILGADGNCDKPATINNCVASFTKYSNKEICGICSNGAPTPDFEACQEFIAEVYEQCIEAYSFPAMKYTQVCTRCNKGFVAATNF